MNLQESQDLHNSVRISARRFEESPFISRYDNPEMIRGVYAGRFHAMYDGEKSDRLYWKLRREALIFDTPERPIEISGPDAAALLDRVLSRRVKPLQEGRGLYAIACTPLGGVFMDGILFKLSSNRYWYVQADGAFETWLVAHCGGLDVKISDPQSRVIQIQGPASQDIMHAASNGSINEGMRYFQTGFHELGGQRLFVSRTGFTGELGYEIYCFGAETDHLALWDHLMKVGEPFGMEFSSSKAMTMRRIEAGILGNKTDMDMTMTPFEAGLGTFVDMTKEDFVGRAALEGSSRHRILLGVTCADTVPTSGTEILRDGRSVGHVRAGVMSPTLGCGIGYARFHCADSWAGSDVELRFADGRIASAKVVEPPFFDREKNIPRGHDRVTPDCPDASGGKESACE